MFLLAAAYYGIFHGEWTDEERAEYWGKPNALFETPLSKLDPIEPAPSD